MARRRLRTDLPWLLYIGGAQSVRTFSNRNAAMNAAERDGRGYTKAVMHRKTGERWLHRGTWVMDRQAWPQKERLAC